MKHLTVRNYEKYQHYKDRRPPWIKLYQEVLEDYAFTRLQDASKAHLMAIWLLASRYENKVPFDAEWIGTAIHATEPVDLDALVSAGFLLVCDETSGALADRTQDAMPEVEGEREKEQPTKQPPREAPPDDTTRSEYPGLTDPRVLLDRLTSERAKAEVTRFLERIPKSQFPGYWVAAVGGWLEGIDMPRMEPATERDIEIGLADYNRLREPTYDAPHVRSFVVRAVRARLREELRAKGEREPVVRNEDWRDRKRREEEAQALADELRWKVGHTETRRQKADGDAWWDRMKREAKAAGVHPVKYGYDHLTEPGASAA